MNKVANQGTVLWLLTGCLLQLPLATGAVAGAEVVEAVEVIEIGASWSYVEYQEQGDSGQTLNEESGDIPGLYLAWTPAFGPHAWGRLEAGYASHNITYDGQTQAGVPLTTTTHARLIHYDGRIGGQWQQGPVVLRPYLFARYQRWDRAIQPTGTSLGLTEYYRWWEAGAGLEGCGNGMVWASELCLDLGLFRTIDGEVEVALGNDPADYPVLQPGDSTGYRAQLRWSPPGLSQLVVSVYHEAWDFKRSPSETVNLGFAQLRIREPASDTRRQGVRVALRF